MNFIIIIVVIGLMCCIGIFRTRHIVNNIEKEGNKHDKKGDE